jgi:ubiquinone/menaquinone biosynthesis C-methylase UbiE
MVNTIQKTNKKTAKKYSRIARWYNICEYPIERTLFQKLRAEAVSYAHKKTLEVGVGTGKNLPYYHHDIELTAIDFSPGMLHIAQEKKGEARLKQLRLHEMDVQHLSFADNTFDTVVSTFVFCTVPDPIAGLREVYRVLKPSGKAIFLEHMKSRYGVVNVLLSMMNLVSTRLLGTSMVRETQYNIELTGFNIESVKQKVFGVFRLIVARKP